MKIILAETLIFMHFYDIITAGVVKRTKSEVYYEFN